MRLTVVQFAAALEIDRERAYDLLRVLTSINLATLVDHVKREDGKGRGMAVYEIAADAPDKLAELLRKATS